MFYKMLRVESVKFWIFESHYALLVSTHVGINFHGFSLFRQTRKNLHLQKKFKAGLQEFLPAKKSIYAVISREFDIQS